MHISTLREHALDASVADAHASSLISFKEASAKGMIMRCSAAHELIV